jgi:hypothetical protein
MATHSRTHHARPDRRREATQGEVLTDVETDRDDLTRLRLIGALREVLGSPR